jgi:hypothetical protein
MIRTRSSRQMTDSRPVDVGDGADHEEPRLVHGALGNLDETGVEPKDPRQPPPADIRAQVQLKYSRLAPQAELVFEPPDPPAAPTAWPAIDQTSGRDSWD